MKSFFNYSKNRILYSLLRLALFVAIGFLIGSLKVNADEVYSRAAEFNWCEEFSGKCYITDVRYNESAKVTLVGPYNATDYNNGKFEYLAGIRFWTWLDGKANDVVSLYYTLTLTGLKESETYSNDWLNSKSSYYSSSNVTILNAKLISNTYSEDKSPTDIEGNPVYLGTQTIKFKVNVQLNVDFSNSSLYVGIGTYSTSSNLSSKLVYQHIATVVTLFADNYYSLDNSSTIINQNDTIINQNEETNNKLDTAENTRKGIWETIKSIPGTIGTFFDNLGTKIGNFFKDLLDGILEGLKKLFIPEDMSFIDNLKESLENKLGFIASVPLQVIDYILALPNKIFTPITSITFPEIPIFGVKFWSGQEIDISEGLKIFQAMKYFGDIACVIIVVNTLNKWYRSFGGGN